MGAMNRGLNLPQIQRIMHEFEKESATMDMKEEMMSDAVDDVMDEDLDDEEEESDKILKQVLDEIGVDLSQQVDYSYYFLLSFMLKTYVAYRCTDRPRCILTAYRTPASRRHRGGRPFGRPRRRGRSQWRRRVRRGCSASALGRIAKGLNAQVHAQFTIPLLINPSNCTLISRMSQCIS